MTLQKLNIGFLKEGWIINSGIKLALFRYILLNNKTTNMKKIFLVTLSIACILSANAQDKVYSTKSGVVKFISEAPLEKIEATNSQVTCKLAGKNGQVIFLMLIKGFTFANSLMQVHFNENYMESSKFQKSEFKGTIDNITSVNFSKDGNYPVNVAGDLTIHGVTKKINAKGSVIVKGGKVSVSSSFKVKVKDYGIEGKYIGEKIANEVDINVNCNLD